MTPLVELHRGPAVESSHAGHVVVVDADGRAVFEAGEPATPVFPRSAIKLLQAMPLVASGAAEEWGYGDRELALACSSHSGEPAHVETARAMLAAAGLDETCLECGGHWSFRQPVLIEQARAFAERPGAICNNCSGKHSGFLALAAHEGWGTTGYIEPDHPVQMNLARHMAELTGEPHDERNRARDGCSIPTYAVPLHSLARAMARACTRSDAAARLLRACTSEPFFTAGTARFCTDYMLAANGAAYCKTGAEGVFCGFLPEQELAIALKVADGAARAAEVTFAVVANAFLDRDGLDRFEAVPVRTWRGIDAGVLRPVPAFHERLLAAAAASR